MSDPAILSEVSADRIRHHIETIVREIPHRAAGSANGDDVPYFISYIVDDAESFTVTASPSTRVAPQLAAVRVATLWAGSQPAPQGTSGAQPG